MDDALAQEVSEFFGSFGLAGFGFCLRSGARWLQFLLVSERPRSICLYIIVVSARGYMAWLDEAFAQEVSVPRGE